MSAVEACQDLYVKQVIPAFRDKNISISGKAKIASRYVSLMVDAKKRQDLDQLRNQYQDLKQFIQEAKNGINKRTSDPGNKVIAEKT